MEAIKLNNIKHILLVLLWAGVYVPYGCAKKSDPATPPAPITPLRVAQATMEGVAVVPFYPAAISPVLDVSFNQPVDRNTVSPAVTYTSTDGSMVEWEISWKRNDSAFAIQPRLPKLQGLTTYNIRFNRQLKSVSGGELDAEKTYTFVTSVDTTAKFPLISNDSLLTLVQKQTFRYFWDFGHPVSGMARERNTSGELVTTGGTGFGIMSMIVAAERGFISRQQAADRVLTISRFLEDKCIRYKGAFAHWINGTTGATIPFSANDNGGDLVETSLLMMGLLTARQYFDGAVPAEAELRQRITRMYEAVEWSWYRRGGQNVLFWHWSPDKDWTMNLRIQGWNECLITYVLAAGSPTHTIPKEVYTEGWARSGSMRNGNSYFGIPLPLGPNLGGSLFFAHYSFLGINPNGLTDTWADYGVQNRSHTRINRQYCIANPLNKRGYSADCWGLTASDIPGGYTASSPTNDRGVIAPTAAIGSLPYTPDESMQALRFFYYALGDRLWKQYGFIDAFSIHDQWFASSFLAIDQGPQIIMIENYRTGLLWNLGMQVPEVRNGLKKLGFSSPLLP